MIYSANIGMQLLIYLNTIKTLLFCCIYNKIPVLYLVLKICICIVSSFKISIFPYFIRKEVQNVLSDLSKVTQIVNSKARIKIKFFLLLFSIICGCLLERKFIQLETKDIYGCGTKRYLLFTLQKIE